MHHRLEVLMPPTDDVEGKLEVVLKDFSENNEEESYTPTFWDWYEVGGRWSGSHNMDGLDQALLDKFYQELKDANVTVSGVQFGKQTISPESQIPFVESVWSKHFPGKCPVFDHYTDGGDVITLAEAKTKKITCDRFIVTDNEFKPQFMAQEDFWNGVNHVESKWDCTVESALAEYAEKTKGYREDYAKKIAPQDNWLLVTVDYHS
jgi:hypothetical protein